MNTQLNAMKQALEAWQTSVYGSEHHHKAMLFAMTNIGTVIEAAEAQPAPVQEPDCWAILTPNGSRLVSPDEAKGRKDAYPLYTTPPAAQLAVPLTREQVRDLCKSAGYNMTSMQARADFINGIRHGEAAHGITEQKGAA